MGFRIKGSLVWLKFRDRKVIDDMKVNGLEGVIAREG